MSAVESGLPIVRQTQCRVGAHHFHWSGSSSHARPTPEILVYCDCGLMQWRPGDDEPIERPKP